MWSLNNKTPYVAERGWIRDSNGAEVWIVAVKATYDILPDGTTRLSSHQQAVNSGPVMYPDSDELNYDTDLGPEKKATDIIINGYAWAPEGKPVTSLAVGCKVGSICRLAYVYGDRIRGSEDWDAPQAFKKMPLRYDRMTSGTVAEGDDVNPLGISISEEPQVGISRLPNIEFVAGNGGEHIGFGPVPRHWPERLRFAGTYDQHWQQTRSPLLPADLDSRFWQIAPVSQYAGGKLRGGEIVTLANMTPPTFTGAQIISFAVPRLSLNLRTRFLDGSNQSHRATLHTLIIEPDHPRISVVWHSALPCHRLVNQLDTTFITEKKRLMLRLTPLPTGFTEWEQL